MGIAAKRLSRAASTQEATNHSTFAAALLAASAGTGRANVLFVGDSYFEGVGATGGRANRWIDKLIVGMRSAYSISGSGMGWQPSRWQDGPSGVSNPVTNGSTAATDNYQGRRGVVINSGGYIEYIVTGDRIDIVYSKTAIAGATVQISVGGVPVDSFDISGGVSYGNVYHYTLGLPATYTVRLTAVGATVGVDGLVVFHGDYDAGLSYWECTRGGATSAFFQPAPAAIHGASDGWANANLHLVIDSLYGNDYLEPGGVATPSTVVTRLQARVARYKALANNPDVILLLYWGLSTYNGDNSLGYNHDDYRVAIKAVADDEGCKIINLYDIYGMAPGSYFSGDGLHPNNTGHQAIADGILDAITGYFAP